MTTKAQTISERQAADQLINLVAEQIGNADNLTMGAIFNDLGSLYGRALAAGSIGTLMPPSHLIEAVSQIADDRGNPADRFALDSARRSIIRTIKNAVHDQIPTLFGLLIDETGDTTVRLATLLTEKREMLIAQRKTSVIPEFIASRLTAHLRETYLSRVPGRDLASVYGKVAEEIATSLPTETDPDIFHSTFDIGRLVERARRCEPRDRETIDSLTKAELIASDCPEASGYTSALRMSR